MKPPSRPATALTCASGSLWTSKGCGPCKGCREAAQAFAASFDRGVFFGDWDERGYKPNEHRVILPPVTT